MKSKLHALVGSFALLCVGTFWASTLVSELFLEHHDVVAVKNGILAAMWLFIPAMAATGEAGSRWRATRAAAWCASRSAA
ncbi:hypothetical protein [Pigmentiphaga litoralis]|uniref:hypothetical protein n=1 Tax=Pigmentiphaga litoralis TaxID=516702 RepID=UPI003B43A71C